MELPDAIVPSGAADAEPSPTEGGLEMPKVNQGAATGEVKIQYASWEDVQALAKSTGKVTVVDVWSTSCLPCIKELPGLVELHKSLGDQVQCITMDVDYDGRKSKPAKSYESDVVEILRRFWSMTPTANCSKNLSTQDPIWVSRTTMT
jgi:thiol-disulfide isomerase/thioredoxin